MQIPMKSIHDAMKGKKILSNARIGCSVGKGSGPEGCYYYLKISDQNHHSAMALLNHHNLLK